MRNKARMIWWAATVLYLAVVYATLGVAPDIWDLIDGLFGGEGRGIIAFYALGTLLAVILLFYMVLIKGDNRDVHYLAFLIFMAIFFVLNVLADNPSEKLHLMEYCGLSFLVYNALRQDLGRFEPRLYVIGVIFCVFAGLIDEFIQLNLPNRVFDWRDILINTLSSVTGFGIIRFNILKRPNPFTSLTE